MSTSDPNIGLLGAQAKPDEYQWATYLGRRHPQLKRHRLRGHVTAAVQHARSYWRDESWKVYELHDDTWINVTPHWQTEIEEKDRVKAERERAAKHCDNPCKHCSISRVTNR